MSEGAPVRVLVVEDEPAIRRGLCDVFAFHGYAVQSEDDGLRALELARRASFDLIVLDVMLPGLDGFRICAELRAAGCETPVLMLTAKGAEDDVVRGFDVGADDYVTKPFSVRELTARVVALLKRSGKLLQMPFGFGPVTVDPGRSLAVHAEGEVALSAREVRILYLLSREPGHIVSRRTLLREVWQMGGAEHVETRTVDVHIAKLRKKLGPHAELLETVRGQGYRLCGRR